VPQARMSSGHGGHSGMGGGLRTLSDNSTHASTGHGLLSSIALKQLTARCEVGGSARKQRQSAPGFEGTATAPVGMLAVAAPSAPASPRMRRFQEPGQKGFHSSLTSEVKQVRVNEQGEGSW
jgi:hypothetical protein